MKRAAEAQLTRDSADDDDSGSDQPAPWKKASEKELARRNIKPLPKRRGFASSASPAPEGSPEPASATAAPKTAPLPSLNPLPSLGTAAPLPKLGATFTFKPPSPAPATKALPNFTFGSLGSSTQTHPLPASTSSSSGKSKDPASALKSLLESYRANNTTGLPAGTGDPVKRAPSFGADGTAKNGKSQGATSKSSSGTFGLQDTPPPISKSNSKGKARLSASPPKSPLKSPNDDPYGQPEMPDEIDEIDEDEDEEDEDGDWVDGDDFANDSGYSQERFDAEFLADDVDVGLDADREEPYMTFEESSHNAQYKYWIHVRGLNNSFIRAAMKMYREDSCADLSGLFEQYEGAKRGIERDFVKWAKIAFGEEEIADEFGTEGYDDEEMEDGEGGKQAQDDEVIVIDDEEEDPDKTPPAQPKPKSPSKSPSKSASRSPTVSKSKPPSAAAPAPAPSTGFKPPTMATSSFSFGGKVIDTNSLSSSSSTGASSGGGWKAPAGFTLPSVSTGTPAGFGFAPTTTAAKPAESAPKPFGFAPSSGSFSLGSTTTAAPAFSFGFATSTADKSKPADSGTTKPPSIFGSAPSSGLSSFGFGAPPKADKAEPATATSAPKLPSTGGTFGAPTTTSTTTFGSSPMKLPSFGSFPGFGPITGGPPGSPFGTKPADDKSSPDTGDSRKTPSSVQSLGTWPASTPDASKPGGLFGLSGGFGSGGTTSSSGFSFGAPPATTPGKDKPANPFGAPKVPIGGSFDNSNPFHVTTGPTISLDSLGGKERAGLGLRPLGGEAPKPEESGDSEGDGALTPKAGKSRVGIANPWAGTFGSSSSTPTPAPSTPSAAPTAGGLKPFTFGLGSKPPSEAPSPAFGGLSGFSFGAPPSIPPPQPAASGGGGFSFADPPPTVAAKGIANPFASPPKPPSLFGTGGFSFGSSTTGTGAAAPVPGGGSAPLFGSAPSFSFGKAPSTLPPFTGAAGLVRGPSGTSSTSMESVNKHATSSQETLLAEPVGEKSASSSGFAGGSQDASAGAGVSQESDVVPEGGTGLALGEDKYDQPGPGEENEESLFNVRGKIMKFSGTSWADLGIGQIRLYKHKETGAKRIFSRNSKSGRIILNFTPFAKMEPKVDDQKAKFMRMTIMDDGKLVKVLVKLKEEKDAADLVKALQREVDALS